MRESCDQIKAIQEREKREEEKSCDQIQAKQAGNQLFSWCHNMEKKVKVSQ